MKSTPIVAIVILNWNGEAYLAEFLPILHEHTTINIHTTIWIADNASTDGSKVYVESHFPEVRWIQHNQNYGFTTGYNKALNQIDADIFVLLNSDLAVSSQWLPPLLDCLQSDDSIAVCQPKILSYRQPTYFEYAGAAGGYIDRWGYPFCRGRLFDYCEIDKGQYDTDTEIFWASGAAMVVRSDVFRQLSGFDDLFFAHMEEIDFCWRAKMVGYKVVFCARSSVYHVGGGSLHQTNPRKTWLNFRNNLGMLYKNQPFPALLLILLVRAILDAVAAFRFLAKREWGNAQAVGSAYGNFYITQRIDWRNARKKWRQKLYLLQPNPKSVSQAQGYWKGSIVRAYFIAGKKKFSDLFTEKK